MVRVGKLYVNLEYFHIDIRPVNLDHEEKHATFYARVYIHSIKSFGFKGTALQTEL